MKGSDWLGDQDAIHYMCREAPNTVIEVGLRVSNRCSGLVINVYRSWNTTVSLSHERKRERSTNVLLEDSHSSTAKVVRPIVVPLLPIELDMPFCTLSMASHCATTLISLLSISLLT